MANILIVEAHKMMQHALAVALGFDHRIQVLARFPEPSVIKDFDLLIVDGAALSEGERQELYNCHAPTVWIDNGSTKAPADCNKLVIINLPVERDRLIAAVTQCLGMAKGVNSTTALADTSVAGAPVKEVKAPDEPALGAFAAPRPRVVELVEVVEEVDNSGDHEAANVKK